MNETSVHLRLQFVDTNHAHFSATDVESNPVFSWHMLIEDWIEMGKPQEIRLTVVPA